MNPTRIAWRVGLAWGMGMMHSSEQVWVHAHPRKSASHGGCCVGPLPPLPPRMPPRSQVALCACLDVERLSPPHCSMLALLNRSTGCPSQLMWYCLSLLQACASSLLRCCMP